MTKTDDPLDFDEVPEEPPMLDAKEARRVTDAAIIRVYVHSDDALKKLLMDATCEVIKRQDLLTAEDVWIYLGPMWERSLNKAQKSVLGHTFRMLIKDGLLEFTGHFQLCIRPRSHQSPMRIWRVVTD